MMIYMFILTNSFFQTEIDLKYRELKSISIVINIINFLGGLAVYCGFVVLYKKTTKKISDIGEYRASWSFLIGPLGLTVFYVAFFQLCIWIFPQFLEFFNITNEIDKKVNTTTLLNLFDLVAGSASGLAFTLLFGRYIAIEFAIKKTKLYKTVFGNFFSKFPFNNSLPYERLISFQIVFLLPIYALAQPLFGSLTIDDFGSPEIFQTCVYGACLVGKFIFFIITYKLIKYKLLHLYLYGQVAQIGNFKKLEDCLGIKSETPNLLEKLLSKGVISENIYQLESFKENAQVEIKDDFIPITLEDGPLSETFIKEKR